MKLIVNGAPREVGAAPLDSLLSVLREELEVTSVKTGCETGGCGTCTVLLDGSPARSCLIPAARAEGAEITTAEGLGTPDDPSPVQRSFLHHYALQCGFCTPGLVVAATAYLDGGGSDDPEAIAAAVSGHVCRCTGYGKIVEAIAAAARGDEFDMESTALDANTVVKTGG